MLRLLRILLLVLPLPALASAPLATLAPFTASYEVRLNNLPFKAKATQTLAHLGADRWRLELRVESFVVDTFEYSEFRWDGGNCHTVPEKYAYTRKGIGTNKRLSLVFDHAAGIVNRDDGKRRNTYAINASTEDKLGHTLALACHVARGKRGTLAINVAWDKDMRELDYRIAAAEETVATPMGSFRALRVERQRTDSDRMTTTWLAAAAGWQSVQMQHTEGDGRLFQLRLLDIRHADPR